MKAKQLLEQVPNVKQPEVARQWLAAARDCLQKADEEGRLYHDVVGGPEPLSTEERNALNRLESLELSPKGQPGSMADSDSIAACARLLPLVREVEPLPAPAKPAAAEKQSQK